MPQHASAIAVVPVPLDGLIDAPSSKSYFQRAIAAALLADGESVLEGRGRCDDTRAALQVAEALGARVIIAGDLVTIRGGLAPVRDEVSCGESGLCIRMFTPIAALALTPVTLSAAGSLRSRPLTMLEEPLAALGARCAATAGHAPVTVAGPLKGGAAAVDGSVSSQFLSGLLMALPRAPYDSTLTVTNLTSRPYVDMTLRVLRDFRVRVQRRAGDIFGSSSRGQGARTIVLIARTVPQSRSTTIYSTEEVEPSPSAP